jgi:S-formylglutathione hydrolase FrmB
MRATRRRGESWYRGERWPRILGCLVVAYLVVVAVWAVVDSGASTRSAPASAARGAAQETASVRGTRQILHVAVPGDPGVTRAVDVYRPPVPDSPDIPVVYLLHGYPGSANEPFEHGIPSIIDRLEDRGYPPFVLVVPDGNGVHHADTEWANAVDGTDQFETFVTTNVIDAVEGANRRDRSRRAIVGFSMGGYGAVTLAFHHPDLFGQVAAIAGYFHVDDTSDVFDHQLAAIDAATPELHLDQARGQRILLVDGSPGGDRVVAGESRLFYQQLVAARVPASYEQLSGPHNWQLVASAFPDVVRFLDASWESLKPAVPSVRTLVSTDEWQGTVAGADVVVSLVGADDPHVTAIEAARSATGAEPVSYAIATVSNPSGASRPISIFKVAFVTRSGTTIDANPAALVVDEWLASTDGRRPGRATGGPTTSLPPSTEKAVRDLARALPSDQTVAPGTTRTFVLVTTAVVRGVGSAFVGDSYAVGSLSAVR